MPKPVSYALGTAKNIINSVCKKLDTNNYKLYLTDSDIKNNFRYQLDNSYKQNRKKLTKPFYYNEIRDYLLNRYNAIMVSGQEADDALGIEQTKDPYNTIIASIDKDLLQIPGYHYNTYNEVITQVSDPGILNLFREKGKPKLRGTGFKWFTAQMLLGDGVDNIKGINGYGDVKVNKVLNQYTRIEDLWAEILKIYGNLEQAMHTAQLLWIRREENQVFTFELIDKLIMDVKKRGGL